jgi:hypothetical protein
VLISRGGSASRGEVNESDDADDDDDGASVDSHGSTAKTVGDKDGKKDVQPEPEPSARPSSGSLVRAQGGRISPGLCRMQFEQRKMERQNGAHQAKLKRYGVRMNKRCIPPAPYERRQAAHWTLKGNL